MSFQRITYPVGPLGCNCSIIYDDKNNEGIIVDPGDEAEKILSTVAECQLTIKAIVHTHAHVDHIAATHEVAQATGATTYLHKEDGFLKDMIGQQAQFIGMATPEIPTINEDLIDGQSITFGEYHLGILHTPGHTPGSSCFCVVGQDLCFTGDTLFKGSVGRTDLWGGDHQQLVSSIKNKLYPLSSSTEVVTGHGPNTTIDFEKSMNPFVKG